MPNVLFLIYDDIVLLDLTGPLQVFSQARSKPGDKPHYHTHVASLDGGPVSTNTPLKVESEPLQNWVANKPKRQLDTLVVVGGDGALNAANDRQLIQQLSQLAASSRRVCSVCSGAILLAATGILDNRRAVTHWEDCDLLASLFPHVRLEVDPIYVQDGHVWTSAGITAGLDMSLAIVREDLGIRAAVDLARSLVTPMMRSGGQSQFSADLRRQTRDIDGIFADLHDWVASNLSKRITVDIMAEHCGMSPRTFSRRYTSIIGEPPAKSVEQIRIDAAREQMTTTKDPLKSIANRCGFSDEERMRRAFQRRFKVSPSTYRSQFSPS